MAVAFLTGAGAGGAEAPEGAAAVPTGAAPYCAVLLRDFMPSLMRVGPNTSLKSLKSSYFWSCPA